MKKLFTLFISAICMMPEFSFAQAALESDPTPARSVSVQPMDNDFNLKARETKEFKIYINNKTSKKMSFNVYLNDWHRDSVGAHVYSVPGTEIHSCARWITFDRKFIEVDTGSVGIVNVKMQLPILLMRKKK